jgi:3-hydroxybutyrate dehydrogenase
MRLENKVALITGSASGIGKVIAIIYAREGAKVAIADLDLAAAEATAREIDPTGKRAIGVAMDVTDEAPVGAGTEKVVATFGTLDVLPVSNAGIQIVAPLVEFELAKWQKLLAIHLGGAFLTTRAALRQMYKQGSGSVIYMGSVHSKEASKLKAPYVTAKHGLIGLARVVANTGNETTSTTTAPVPPPGWLERDTLTGDWGGLRSWLKDRGITLKPRLTRSIRG